MLNKLRDDLRDRFETSDLQHTIDARYRLQTAHMTAVRFKEPLADLNRFLKNVIRIRDQDFGSCLIDKIELVGNNWYQQKEKVRLVDTFALG